MDIENNLFVYYGVKIGKSDYERLSNKNGTAGFYGRVLQQGLRYRECGDRNTTWEYVIGAEIYWNYDKNITELEYGEDGNIYIGGKILKINNESEIREKLLDLDLQAMPKYYIFNCWREKDDNKEDNSR